MLKHSKFENIEAIFIRLRFLCDFISESEKVFFILKTVRYNCCIKISINFQVFYCWLESGDMIILFSYFGQLILKSHNKSLEEYYQYNLFISVKDIFEEH